MQIANYISMSNLRIFFTIVMNLNYVDINFFMIGIFISIFNDIVWFSFRICIFSKHDITVCHLKRCVTE